MTDLREQLLQLMDRKRHWAYPALTRPGLSRTQLRTHFRHEYLVYVRDFPVLLARALGITPPLEEVRMPLAANLYEEQTGGLSGTAPHPRLFLKMMAGLGFPEGDFCDEIVAMATIRGAGEPAVADGGTALQPAARTYRDFLVERSAAEPWQAAVALLTIFVEGSANERAELAGTFVRARGEQAVRAHPLVVHYGCPPEAMALTRAHAEVEGGHRTDAWEVLLRHTPDASAAAAAVLATCSHALDLWLRYRDGVADAMGLASFEGEGGRVAG